METGTGEMPRLSPIEVLRFQIELLSDFYHDEFERVAARTLEEEEEDEKEEEEKSVEGSLQE